MHYKKNNTVDNHKSREWHIKEWKWKSNLGRVEWRRSEIIVYRHRGTNSVCMSWAFIIGLGLRPTSNQLLPVPPKIPNHTKLPSTQPPNTTIDDSSAGKKAQRTKKRYTLVHVPRHRGHSPRAENFVFVISCFIVAIVSCNMYNEQV